jgi:hypothetical protein
MCSRLALLEPDFTSPLQTLLSIGNGEEKNYTIPVGDTHSLVGNGGGANSDEGTDTMVLCLLIPSL